MIHKVLISLLVACVLLELNGCGSLVANGSNLSSYQISGLKQEGFVQTEEGWEYIASERLLFGSNEANLLPSAQQTVERIAHVLLSIDISKVRIDGHTDVTGANSYNDLLSKRRAQVVADAMVMAGMSASDIKVRALGSRLPIASNQSAEGRAQNRRVVLVVSGN